MLEVAGIATGVTVIVAVPLGATVWGEMLTVNAVVTLLTCVTRPVMAVSAVFVVLVSVSVCAAPVCPHPR